MYRQGVTDEEMLDLLGRAVDAVREALSLVDDWRPMTERPSQYAIDLVADAAAIEVLLPHGVGVLSEESGRHAPRDGLSPVTVVVDPVDGSTNAGRGIPWYATSLCALDEMGPWVAVVANQATGERFDAIRGGGARLNGNPIGVGACTSLADAMVGISGLPPAQPGWNQFRALGAAALDLCAVACGRLDAYLDTSEGSHGAWDYLGGMLVCTEAGAVVADKAGRDLIVLDHDARRAPVAAATTALLDELMARSNRA